MKLTLSQKIDFNEIKDMKEKLENAICLYIEDMTPETEKHMEELEENYKTACALWVSSLIQK